MSLWYRAENIVLSSPDGRVEAKVQWLDAQGVGIPANTMVIDLATPTMRTTPPPTVETAPAGAARIQIRIRFFAATGTLYVDDFTVYPIGSPPAAPLNLQFIPTDLGVGKMVTVQSDPRGTSDLVFAGRAQSLVGLSPSVSVNALVAMVRYVNASSTAAALIGGTEVREGGTVLLQLTSPGNASWEMPPEGPRSGRATVRVSCDVSFTISYRTATAVRSASYPAGQYTIDD